MISVHERERTTLHDDGATAEVVYAGPHEARVHVTTDPGRHGPDVGAALLCAAVSQARARQATLVRTVLDASAPSGAISVAALRARVGADVADITMRRAGASVVVTLDLLPSPSLPRTAHVPATTAGHAGAGRGGADVRPPARPGAARRTAARSLRRTS